MKVRVKRVIAFMLSLVLFATSFMSENLVVVQAAPTEETSMVVQFGESDILTELAGLVSGHELDDLKLKVSYNGESKEVNINSDNKECTVPYNADYSYEYTLQSEKYELVLGQNISSTGTLSASDIENGYTFKITEVKPKYNISVSPKNAVLEAGQKGTAFSAQVDAAEWKDQIVTWSLSSTDNAAVAANGNTCTVDVNDTLSADNVDVTLIAIADNGASVNVPLKLNKKGMALIVSPEGSDWGSTTVTVQTNPAVKDISITLNDGVNDYSGTTNEKGAVVFGFTAVQNTEYKFIAASKETGTYRAAVSDQVTYQTNKKNQTIVFTPAENVIVTYGDKDIVLGTVALEGNGGTGAYTGSALTDGTENGTVTIDTDGTVKYTPDFSGEVIITLTKAADANYNTTTTTTSVEVAKKVVTVKNVKAEEKVYDQKADNIVVTAELEGTVDENVTLKTSEGTVENENAGIQKLVTAELTIDDDHYKKYAFADTKGALTNTIEVETEVTITKAPIVVTVGNADKEWQTADEKDNLIKFTGFIYDGFIGTDKELKDPEIIYATPSGACVGSDYQVISIKDMEQDESSEYVGANYYISEVVNGYLTIIEESNIDYTEHLEIDNSEKLEYHVYQPETSEPTIYYGSDGSNESYATAKFNFKSDSSPYTTLWRVDETGATKIGSENNITLPADKDKEFYMTNDTETAKSVNFKFDFIRDTDSPVIEIKSGDNNLSLKELTEAITFGLFSNDEVTVDITVSDNTVSDDIVSDDTVSNNFSGIATWTVYKCVYKDDTLADTENENLTTKDKIDIIKKSIESIEEPNLEGMSYQDVISKSEQNYYVYYVEATDNVGNSILVGSNGIIIENTNLKDIEVTAAGQNGGADKKYNFDGTDGTVAYFNSDVELNVKVNDDNQSFYTGVAKCTCEVLVNGAKNLQEVTIELKKKPQENQSIEDNPFALVEKSFKGLTLEEIHALSADETITFSVEKGKGSKYFELAIDAEDAAGNNARTKNVSFVIDKENPVISASIETTKNENAVDGYFNKEVSIPVTIKERYLDKDKVIIAGVIDGEKFSYNLAAVENGDAKSIGLTVSDIKSFDDEADDNVEKTFTLVFNREDNTEAEYNVNISATDRAGNKTVSEDVSFVIDKKAPVMEFTYTKYSNNNEETPETFVPSSNKKTPTYLSESYASFAVALKVTERYFSEKDKDGNDCVNNSYEVTATDVNGDSVIIDLANDANILGTWESVEDSHTYTLTLADDANYSFEYSMYDNAGNAGVWVTNSESDENVPNPAYVTLDKTRPTGTITLTNLQNFDENSERNKWEEFLQVITFGLFGKDKVTAELSSADITSGVSTTEYYVSNKAISYDDIQKKEDGWISYGRAIDITANRQAIVYEKVVDKAGNTEYFSSNGFIVDATNPLPEITITPSSPAWGKGVYSAKDNPGFDIHVIDPAAADKSYSGLKFVTYKIVNGTTGATEEVTVDIKKSAHQQIYTKHITVDPTKFYSNDVKITVTAGDWSSNEQVSKTAKMAIDNQAPVVKFAFDTSDVQNQKYYKNNKVLTITVNERNFDPSYTPVVTSSAGGGYSFSGWSVSGEVATGTITFSGDSDYTVTYDCYDLAGNKSNTERLEEFTVDKTLSVIKVSYDNNSAQNGNYYKSPRTATITIVEHNFRASDVKVTTTASNGSAPGIRGWSSSGDRHTATIYFGSDADYTFDISYVDLAGNNAADYQQDKFTVDLTDPTVEITGVENKSANKGTVAPSITINDTNFNADGATVTLTGAKKGSVDISGMASRTTTGTGQVISFNNFADDMDDIYTLTAKSVDKAGNETSQTITFSVNRHGSTYDMSKDTKSLLEKKYTNKPVDVVVYEINVDTLEFVELSYSKDGEIVKLTEGKDYKVEVSGSDSQWKQYTYTIFASCFEEEGKYNINISSVDRAENESNNKVQSATLEFTVDKTAPTMAISNLDDRGRYDAETHEFTLDVKDNTLLSKVELYLDGELVRVYESDELVVENGKLYITIDSKDKFQTVKLIAYDEAGNPTEPAEYSVLVTANGWVQFVANKPLFYGSIAALAVIAGFIFFIIWKRKKDKQENA